MAFTARRVVANTDEDGASYFAMDGPAPQIVDQPGRGLVFHELWNTDGVDGDTGSEDDPGAREVSHHPTPGGTKVRIVEFLPDQTRDAGAVRADLARLGAEDIATEGSTDPTFHANDTVDYNIILSGEIYAVTQREETLLRAGDVLIQRGTAHTWSNRSDVPCVYASIMVSAQPLEAQDRSS